MIKEGIFNGIGEHVLGPISFSPPKDRVRKQASENDQNVHSDTRDESNIRMTRGRTRSGDQWFGGWGRFSIAGPCGAVDVMVSFG